MGGKLNNEIILEVGRNTTTVTGSIAYDFVFSGNQLSLPKNCMVFLRIIPVKKVDEVHRIVYNTESAERISQH